MSKRLLVGSPRGQTRRVGLSLSLAIGLVLGVVPPLPAAAAVAQAAVASPFDPLLAYSRDLGPVSPSERVSFLTILRDPAGTRRNAGLAAMYDPQSPAFQHYWTARQWARRRSPK